jgi:anti-anti-sigma factor
MTTEQAVAVEVTVRDLDGAIEVTLSGVVDAALLGRLGEAVRAVAGPDKPTILNLEGLSLLDGDGFDALVGPLSWTGGFDGEVSVVCAHPRAADELRRWGVNPSVPIYCSVDVAVARSRDRALVSEDGEPSKR